MCIVLMALSVPAWSQSAFVEALCAVNWTAGEIRLDMALDLAGAGIRLPGGRLRGEEVLRGEYPVLLRPFLLSILADSSGTLEEWLRRGDASLPVLDALGAEAEKSVPALSRDLRRLETRYTLKLDLLSAALTRHRRPAELPRPLSPGPEGNYTSIIIIADGELPVRGRRTTSLPEPCLFPKVWDSEMNLMYERNTGDPENRTRMVRYARSAEIFRPTPSGLEGSLAEFAGERPLRIIARELFGIHPTDLVISRENALEILASENSRRLLREHKVIFVLPDRSLGSE